MGVGTWAAVSTPARARSRAPPPPLAFPRCAMESQRWAGLAEAPPRGPPPGTRGAAAPESGGGCPVQRVLVAAGARTMSVLGLRLPAASLLEPAGGRGPSQVGQGRGAVAASLLLQTLLLRCLSGGSVSGFALAVLHALSPFFGC